MLDVQLFTLLTSQQLGRLEHILALSAIQLELGQRLNLLLRNAALLALEEIAPHRLPALIVELGIVQTEVDPRLKRRVNVVNAVRGEEENAFVVLEQAQEDADELVALEVVRGAGFEEDVGLVEAQNGVPLCGHFENVGQGLLDA